MTTTKKRREPRCEGCGAVIIDALTDAPGAVGYLCLECSGAVLEDFLEEGMTEEDYAEDRVHHLRTFHGH